MRFITTLAAATISAAVHRPFPGDGPRGKTVVQDGVVAVSYDCADPEERADGIAAAIEALRHAEAVVFPTDTSYGVGVDAFQPVATSALMAIKGRGRQVPLSVLVGSWRALDGLAGFVPPTVRALVEAFWPGSLTLVVQHAATLAWDLGGTGGAIAVRMPLHPVALELLGEIGPMAVSGANRSGWPLATTAAEARDQLGYQVAVYLDGGPTGYPVPSTIVDVTGPVPRVLRPGAVGLDRLREVNPAIEAAGSTAPEAGNPDSPADPDHPVDPDSRARTP